MKPVFAVAAILSFPIICLGAGSLDSYLLRPADLPVACKPVNGFYPVNEKVDFFYQYKIYRSALPLPVDRHAQSFDCAGQKGTVYFFSYATADQAQAAELFAQPVLSAARPVPLFRDWPMGFIIVSFVHPPEELLAALDVKLGHRVSPTLDTTTASILSSTVPATIMLTSTAAVSELTPIPLKTSPVIARSVPTALVPDLSDTVVKNLMKKVPCRGSNVPDEGKAICDLLREFQRGDALGAVIPADKSLVGVIYEVDKDGGINGPAYQAAVGSGRPREVAIVSLFSANGVEDFETQALVESRREHRPSPTNEIATRLAKLARPDQPTAFPTKGRSLVVPMQGERKLFVRQTDRAWYLIGVSGNTPEEQMGSESTVAVLY